ncbi:unnamed protein product [Vitrella brassicaformis CCMP3155]|uniref:protein-tyrosine-phosphatase n=1 Tax=Vitrella brassicaformis (strain CCMP3155) TaxID=1169540 RepID=A0A0G4EA92_VITBC|nr:unnamed protein product [Vitrella brassicaformis CCMP3155]|eukprot:CEL92162.1 unnamed protein product [Vitrella brassicaformis CCMP3155]
MVVQTRAQKAAEANKSVSEAAGAHQLASGSPADQVQQPLANPDAHEHVAKPAKERKKRTAPALDQKNPTSRPTQRCRPVKRERREEVIDKGDALMGPYDDQEDTEPLQRKRDRLFAARKQWTDSRDVGVGIGGAMGEGLGLGLVTGERGKAGRAERRLSLAKDYEAKDGQTRRSRQQKQAPSAAAAAAAALEPSAADQQKMATDGAGGGKGDVSMGGMGAGHYGQLRSTKEEKGSSYPYAAAAAAGKLPVADSPPRRWIFDGDSRYLAKQEEEYNKQKEGSPVAAAAAAAINREGPHTPHTPFECQQRANVRRGDGDVPRLPQVQMRQAKHAGLRGWPRISPDTLARFLQGKFDHRGFSGYTILDARWEAESDGGHIRKAIHARTNAEAIDALWDENGQPRHDKNHVVIVHCEYSQERGPNLMRAITDYRDSHGSSEDYPMVYVLDGGYRAFWRHAQAVKCAHRLCDGQYKPEDALTHQELKAAHQERINRDPAKQRELDKRTRLRRSAAPDGPHPPAAAAAAPAPYVSPAPFLPLEMPSPVNFPPLMAPPLIPADRASLPFRNTGRAAGGGRHGWVSPPRQTAYGVGDKDMRGKKEEKRPPFPCAAAAAAQPVDSPRRRWLFDGESMHLVEDEEMDEYEEPPNQKQPSPPAAAAAAAAAVSRTPHRWMDGGDDKYEEPLKYDDKSPPYAAAAAAAALPQTPLPNCPATPNRMPPCGSGGDRSISPPRPTAMKRKRDDRSDEQRKKAPKE